MAYQDNNPKHSSKFIDDFLKEQKITLLQSPLTIEYVWGSLEQFLQSQYKPKSIRPEYRHFGFL